MKNNEKDDAHKFNSPQASCQPREAQHALQRPKKTQHTSNLTQQSLNQEKKQREVVDVTVQENRAYIRILQIDIKWVYATVREKGAYRLQNKAKQRKEGWKLRSRVNRTYPVVIHQETQRKKSNVRRKSTSTLRRKILPSGVTNSVMSEKLSKAKGKSQQTSMTAEINSIPTYAI
jgi:hypothetical protein